MTTIQQEPLEVQFSKQIERNEALVRMVVEVQPQDTEADADIIVFWFVGVGSLIVGLAVAILPKLMSALL